MITADPGFYDPTTGMNTGLDTGNTGNEGAASANDLGGVPPTPEVTATAAASDPTDPNNRNGLNTSPIGDGGTGTDPSVAAANQGQSGYSGFDGSSPPPGVDPGVWANTVAGSASAARQSQPAPSETAGANNVPGFVDTRGLNPNVPGVPGQTSSGPNVPGQNGVPSGTDMAAGPGWEINARGQFSSTNTPDYVRANQGFTSNGIGPGTLIDRGTAGNIDQAGGTANWGPRPFDVSPFSDLSAAQQAKVTPDVYGVQQMRGGLYGGWQPGGVPGGAGVNMEWNGKGGNQQAQWNATLGIPPLGGGGVTGSGPAPGTAATAPGVTHAALATAGGASGGANVPANDPWAQHFYQTFGFYDPQYDSRDTFLANAQEGDRVIRGAGVPGGTGPDQLAEMAKVDPDAKRILDAINALPDFYQSQNAANWITGHDAQITLRAQGMSDPYARLNLESQAYNNVANPVSNMKALMTGTLTKSVNDLLTANGASGFSPVFDPYGNVTSLTWTSAGGKQQQWPPAGTSQGPLALADYGQLLDILEKNFAAAATPPAAGGGGGAGARGSSPGYPRAGGSARTTGGSVPPSAPTPPATALWTPHDYAATNGMNDGTAAGVLNYPNTVPTQSGGTVIRPY